MASDPQPAFSFGDVILVKFPFTNQTASKQRPAVVVSSHEYNRQKPDLVMMAIASQVRASTAFGEVFVTQWQTANLLKPSAIKPVFATIEQQLVIRALGRLQDQDVSALVRAIQSILG